MENDDALTVMKALSVIPDRSKEEGPIRGQQDKSLFLSASPKKTDPGYHVPLPNKDNFILSINGTQQIPKTTPLFEGKTSFV